jgi:hypothetical protein
MKSGHRVFQLYRIRNVRHLNSLTGIRNTVQEMTTLRLSYLHSATQYNVLTEVQLAGILETESQFVMTEIMNNDLSVTTSCVQTMLAYCVQFANLAQWVVCNCCSRTSCFSDQAMGWTVWGLIHSKWKKFASCPRSQDVFWGTPSGWRRPERDADRSPPSCAQVKNDCSQNSNIPHLHARHMNNSTLSSTSYMCPIYCSLVTFKFIPPLSHYISSFWNGQVSLSRSRVPKLLDTRTLLFSCDSLTQQFWSVSTISNLIWHNCRLPPWCKWGLRSSGTLDNTD